MPIRTSVPAGFTTIELLVVISIVVLLISLLLPSLQKARAVAYAAVCDSNLRQQAIAHLTYTNDYRQWFIQGRTHNGWVHYYDIPGSMAGSQPSAGGDGSWPSWIITGLPYNDSDPTHYAQNTLHYVDFNQTYLNINSQNVINSANDRNARVPILSCPAINTTDLVNHDTHSTWRPYGQALNDVKVFYCINGEPFGGLPPPFDRDCPVRLSYVSRPSIAFSFDSIYFENGHGEVVPGLSGFSLTDLTLGCLPQTIAPHLGSCNWVGFDGHVQQLHADSLSAIYLKYPLGVGYDDAIH